MSDPTSVEVLFHGERRPRHCRIGGLVLLYYVNISNGGVDQAGPVKCRRDQFGSFMAKIDALVEAGAVVSLSRYDPELAEKEYEDDNVSGRPQPKYDHGYTTVGQFPKWPGF